MHWGTVSGCHWMWAVKKGNQWLGMKERAEGTAVTVEDLSSSLRDCVTLLHSRDVVGAKRPGLRMDLVHEQCQPRKKQEEKREGEGVRE